MRTTAAAPSDICELLPAVTLPRAAKTVFSLARVSQRGIRARALVDVGHALAVHDPARCARSGAAESIS